MKRLLRYLLYILLAALAFNLLIVPLLEPTAIFFPIKTMRSDPASVGLKFQDIYLTAKDGVKLNAWYLDNQAVDKVILLFHGNGGNISHRLEILQVLYSLPADVLIIDYHGYGNSGGRPSEDNLYLDAEAAYDFLVREKQYEPKQIIIMGSSLGGAVAIWLAVQEEAGGLIIQKAFTSAADMAVKMNPLYRKPIVWLKTKFNNLEEIGNVTEPKLIIHSKKDEIIPYEMSVKLFKAAREPKELLLLERGGHNDIYISVPYLEALRKMMRTKD